MGMIYDKRDGTDRDKLDNLTDVKLDRMIGIYEGWYAICLRRNHMLDKHGG